MRALAHKLPGSTLLSLLLPPGIRCRAIATVAIATVAIAIAIAIATVIALWSQPALSRNFIRNNYWFLLDPRARADTPPYLLYTSTTPATSTQARCKEMRVGREGEVEEEEEETDEECFLVTPEGRRKTQPTKEVNKEKEEEARVARREAKFRLLAKCMEEGERGGKGEQGKRVQLGGARVEVEEGKGGVEERRGRGREVEDTTTTEEDSPAPPPTSKRFRLCRAPQAGT